MPNAHLFTKQTPAFEIDRCFLIGNKYIYIYSAAAAADWLTHRTANNSTEQDRATKKAECVCPHSSTGVWWRLHSFRGFVPVTLATATNIAMKESYFVFFSFFHPVQASSTPLPFRPKRFHCFPSSGEWWVCLFEGPSNSVAIQYRSRVRFHYYLESRKI